MVPWLLGHLGRGWGEGSLWSLRPAVDTVVAEFLSGPHWGSPRTRALGAKLERCWAKQDDWSPQGRPSTREEGSWMGKPRSPPVPPHVPWSCSVKKVVKEGVLPRRHRE